MKLIILTQYFPPEIGAPQNRLFEIAVRLQKRGVDIQVLPGGHMITMEQPQLLADKIVAIAKSL